MLIHMRIITWLHMWSKCHSLAIVSTRAECTAGARAIAGDIASPGAIRKAASPRSGCISDRKSFRCIIYVSMRNKVPDNGYYVNFRSISRLWLAYPVDSA